MSAFPPVAELVPHAGPMILLDALTAWAPGEARCALTIREGTPFVRDGVVESCATIEHMAQGVAVCLGYEALQRGEGVRVGMVIACKRFDVHEPRRPLRVGDRAEVHVARTRGSDSLSHFECRVERAGEPFVSALLTLFHAEQPPD